MVERVFEDGGVVRERQLVSIECGLRGAVEACPEQACERGDEEREEQRERRPEERQRRAAATEAEAALHDARGPSSTTTLSGSKFTATASPGLQPEAAPESFWRKLIRGRPPLSRNTCNPAPR